MERMYPEGTSDLRSRVSSGKKAASVLPAEVAAARITSVVPERSGGIAYSCTARRLVQPCDQIHRWIRSSSSPNEAVSEFEGSELIFGFDGVVCFTTRVCLNVETLNETGPLHLWILLQDRQQVDERRDCGSRRAEVAFT